MNTASSPYRVHECFKCQRDTEYYCVSCSYDLCLLCIENHTQDRKTYYHNIKTRRKKINYIPQQEICVRHRSKVYTKYCEPCQVPACNNCQTHKKHKKINVKTAYKTKRQQHRGTIHTIRSEDLFYRTVLLTEIKADVKTCHTKLSLHQSAMLTKAQTLKNIIDFVLYDLLNNMFCDFNFNHRCFKQKIDMIGHIVSLQRFVHIYEQRRVIRPLKFLFSIKTALPHIHLTLHTSQLSMSESLNKDNVMESLSAIEITEGGNRRAENSYWLGLTCVDGCAHISFVTSDRVWVSGMNNLMLTDSTGVHLHRVEDSGRDVYDGRGSHTVNSESELIYIDRNANINKLSKDMKITTTLIEKTDSLWEPRSVYWSPSTGDVLVGKYNYKKRTGKVTRYNPSGQLIHTIQNNKKRPLYDGPDYITENNNGDVVVSDRAYDSDYMLGSVVVTERGGRYRFTFYGENSLLLRPYGICTDALSHILVCDYVTDTVLMLNKDGQFLAHLPIGSPWGLSYDVNTHRLWAGYREHSGVLVLKYITRQDALAEEHTPCSDKDPMFSSTPAVGWISTYPPPFSG